MILEPENPLGPAMADRNLFEWLDAFASRLGPHNTTRLVLWTLYKFMNRKTGCCFPSIDKISEASGLTSRCVRNQLKKAEDEGWITRSQKNIPGRGWALYHYQCRIPAKVRNEIQCQVKNGPERGSAPQGDGPERGSGGAEYDDIKVRNEVPTNYTVNYSRNQPTTAQKILSMGLNSEFTKQCDRLRELSNRNGKMFDPDKFIKDHDQNNFHPKAIIEAFTALADRWATVNTTPERYAMGIIRRINGKYYEQDSISESNEHKKQLQASAEELPRFEPDSEQWAAAKTKIKSNAVN